MNTRFEAFCSPDRAESSLPVYVQTAHPITSSNSTQPVKALRTVASFTGQINQASGRCRLNKTCLFDDHEEMAGELRTTKMIMVDAVTRKGRSSLEYRKMKLRNLPDKVFTKQCLKKN